MGTEMCCATRTGSKGVVLVLSRTISFDLLITESIKRMEGKIGKIREERKETIKEWEIRRRKEP